MQLRDLSTLTRRMRDDHCRRQPVLPQPDWSSSSVSFCYTAAVLAVGQRFPATRGDNLVLNLLVGFPVQLLLYVYLFAAFIKIRARRRTQSLVGWEF